MQALGAFNFGSLKGWEYAHIGGVPIYWVELSKHRIILKVELVAELRNVIMIEIMNEGYAVKI